ncbi:hypothetical protein EGM97_09260 [Pseudomonas sp. AF32]|nr:hypothetical protein [Pseudomonas sp. AF32]
MRRLALSTPSSTTYRISHRGTATAHGAELHRWASTTTTPWARESSHDRYGKKRFHHAGKGVRR